MKGIGNIIFKIAVVCLICFGGSSKATGQLTILSIDSIQPLEPLVIGDTTDFYVELSVDDIGPLNIDSLLGNLFYLYWTDSMQNSLQLPRIIDLDLSIIWVPSFKADTVPIDIRPNEIRTEPANLIILWPAMVNPLILDTNGISIQIPTNGTMPTLGVEQFFKDPNQLIFPCPAIQFINIRPEEIKLIKQIKILSMEGKVLNEYSTSEFSSGNINVAHLAVGTYFVEMNYNDGKVVRTKILKNQ
jgi:hypothetical protein